MADLPASFHDLPLDAVPFTIEFHKAPPDESPGPVKTVTVAGPGALSIPAFGWPTWARVRYADGTVYDAEPPAEDPDGVMKSLTGVDLAAREQAGFTCPSCGRTSRHPRDVEEGYCGACHDWTGQPRRERS